MYKNIEIFLNKYLKTGYFLSILLIGLPPIFVVFSFINIHSIAKLIWLLSFFAIAFGLYRDAKIDIGKTLLILFLIYFLTQSASIITTKNVLAYLERYEDLFFSSIFVIVSAVFIKDIKSIRKIVHIFFFVALVNLFLQTLIFVYPNLFLKVGEIFIHKGYLELIDLNIQRKRIYLDIYDEVLIPIIFLLLLKGRKRKVLTPFLILISFFSFVSNFRTRFLMLIASFVGSLVVFFKKAKGYLVALLPLAILFYFLYSLLIQTVGFTVIQRVLLEDKAEDVRTISSRIARGEKSIEIGLSSPIFGVGLGNYYDNLDFPMQKVFSRFKSINKEFELAAFYPHNIFFRTFAETGFLGLISLMMLFAYFIKKDAVLLIGNKDLPKAFVVAFWILFIHAFFNPSSTVKFQSLFWLIRILIEKTEGIQNHSILLITKSSNLKFGVDIARREPGLRTFSSPKKS